jgi:hypothetical protein
MASSSKPGSLSEFADVQHLSPGSNGDLPHVGALLEQADFKVDGAAHGMLPGGRNGILLLGTYTSRSDDCTTTHHKTAVVLRVPESMGYAPYLQMGRAIGLSAITAGAKTIEVPPGLRVLADPGIDERWLAELFSPAFSEWLSRSPDDFGAELISGVLVVLRDGHHADATTLTNLCTDAAKIADAIRDEAVEEVESGGGAVAKAKAPSRDEAVAAALVPKLGGSGPPAHVESTLATSRDLAVRTPAVWGMAVRTTILWILGVNVVGGGIYGLLLNLPNPKLVVLIYQVILLLIIGPIVFRKKTSSIAKTSAEEAFWLGFAKSHDLKPVEPLRFSAEYAEAGLPGKPVRVFEGLFGGTAGHLMTTGDGRERGQQIALIRGPHGPTATTELNVSAPGISTAALDGFIETLLLDLETAPAQAAESRFLQVGSRP